MEPQAIPSNSPRADALAADSPSGKEGSKSDVSILGLMNFVREIDFGAPGEGWNPSKKEAEHSSVEDEEKSDWLEETLGLLRDPASTPRGETDVDSLTLNELLRNGFLDKCRFETPEKAASKVRKFVAFRKGAGWPFRITFTEVENVVTTGMHWLLPRKEDASHNASDMASHFPRGEDGGPAGCLVYT